MYLSRDTSVTNSNELLTLTTHTYRKAFSLDNKKDLFETKRSMLPVYQKSCVCPMASSTCSLCCFFFSAFTRFLITGTAVSLRNAFTSRSSSLSEEARTKTTHGKQFPAIDPTPDQIKAIERQLSRPKGVKRHQNHGRDDGR